MATLINPTMQLLDAEEMYRISSQRAEMRKRHADAIFLFRIGDFYHLIAEDAQRTMRFLQIRPAIVDGIKQISFKRTELDNNLPKLIRANFRVAICGQLDK